MWEMKCTWKLVSLKIVYCLTLSIIHLLSCVKYKLIWKFDQFCSSVYLAGSFCFVLFFILCIIFYMYHAACHRMWLITGCFNGGETWASSFHHGRLYFIMGAACLGLMPEGRRRKSFFNLHTWLVFLLTDCILK